jgi:folylpolyglutamate synthase/dihydropteroate synthase
MLAPLVASVDAVVATRFAQPRSLPPTELAEAVRNVGGTQVDEAPDLAAALDRARQLAEGGTIVVCGSLMLVGEARSLLLGAPTDPFVVTDPAP